MKVKLEYSIAFHGETFARMKDAYHLEWMDTGTMLLARALYLYMKPGDTLRGNSIPQEIYTSKPELFPTPDKYITTRLRHLFFEHSPFIPFSAAKVLIRRVPHRIVLSYEG